MKTILVATDFSKASNAASVYGLKLARAFNARLILFNCYQHVPVPAGEVPMFVESEAVKKLVLNRLQNTSEIINYGQAVDIKTCCEEGPAAETILRAATNKKADIIIVGMKRTGRSFRRIFGSTVTALARTTTIPLIVVPQNTKYSDPEAIALANETDIEEDTDKHVFDALIGIIKKFHSRLYMVRVAKNKYHEAFEMLNHPVRLNKMVSPLGPQYEYLYGTNTPQVLNEFISKHNVNMLALLPHKHSLFERLFIKSITRSMTFATHIPLLIMPDVQKVETKQTRYNEEILA